MKTTFGLAFAALLAGVYSGPGRATDSNSVPAPPAAALEAAPATHANTLRLNFRGAPLDLVLDYLSDAAGFVIDKQADLRGTADLWSKEPVSKEEAVRLLSATLRKNGYALIRKGRILTIVSRENAKTADLEVVSGNQPDAVEKSDEVVAQLIPVRYANASQLMNNLQILLPASATLSVNESANTLILVATKTDIRRMLKIVNALDTSLASVSTIRVFPLRYADAKQLASVVQQLFAPATSTQANSANPRAQLFNMMPGGGPGGFGGPDMGGFGPGGTVTAATGSSGSAATAKVTTAADEYSNSLIVTGPAEMLTTIGDMVKQMNQPASGLTELRAFHLVHADATEVADQIAQLFPDETKSGSNQSQGQVRFGGGPPFGPFGGGPPGAGGAQTENDPSERSKKQGRVLAVADARTSSVLVSAAGALMPQIAKMVAELDSSSGRPELVKVWELNNADPQTVSQVMQDLFNRNITMRNNNSGNSLLGQNNPLATRETTQANTTSSSSSGFGNSPGGTMSGGGATGAAGF